MSDYVRLEKQVMQWLLDRKIIPNSTPGTQLLKSFSEMGELADATIKGDREGIKDGVGDVVVCLIAYCALQGIDLAECLAGAYAEIKNRTGELLPNGVFVKD